jgi:hypothetical protein
MWNPFRKSAKVECVEEAEAEMEEPEELLPDFGGREDTQRVSQTLDGLRMRREAAAEKLEETAEEVEEAAKQTSHTLRSMAAFVIPKAAKAGVGE